MPHRDSARRLIIAADDFGLTERINEAIAAACRGGVVTSASLMVTAAAFHSAAEIARREPDLDVGLHLNLTEGRPTADPERIPSIAGPRGFLYNHPAKLWAASIRGKVEAGHLELEIRAQVERALDHGVALTHVDGHKHVHAAPSVLRILRRVLPDYGIRAMRLPRERVPRLLRLLASNPGSRRQIGKQFVFGKLISTATRLASPKNAWHGWAGPKRFYGITQTGFLDLAAFADIVRDLDGGVHELMCHPGYVDDALRRTPTRLLAQRERELALLTGAEARAVLDRARVALIRYRDLVQNDANHRSNSLFDRCPAL